MAINVNHVCSLNATDLINQPPRFLAVFQWQKLQTLVLPLDRTRPFGKLDPERTRWWLETQRLWPSQILARRWTQGTSSDTDLVEIPVPVPGGENKSLYGLTHQLDISPQPKNGLKKITDWKLIGNKNTKLIHFIGKTISCFTIISTFCSGGRVFCVANQCTCQRIFKQRTKTIHLKKLGHLAA